MFACIYILTAFCSKFCDYYWLDAIPHYWQLMCSSLLIECIALLLLLFIPLKSLFSFVASISAFLAPHASTLLAQANMCLLVISFVFLITVNSLIITYYHHIIFLYTVYKLLLRFYLSFVPKKIAYILRWSIQSSAFSFCYLISLQYCNDEIVSLWWTFNFSLNAMNNLMLVLHFSCSSLFRVHTILSPS